MPQKLNLNEIDGFTRVIMATDKQVFIVVDLAYSGIYRYVIIAFTHN